MRGERDAFWYWWDDERKDEIIDDFIKTKKNTHQEK